MGRERQENYIYTHIPVAFALLVSYAHAFCVIASFLFFIGPTAVSLARVSQVLPEAQGRHVGISGLGK